nr:MAG TPA: hypothetical protein [Caudoviricetes sp.]
MIFKKVLLLSVSYNKKVTPSRFLSSKPHIYRCKFSERIGKTVKSR